MFSLTVSAVAVGLVGIAAALAVMHHEGHLELPRWIGWRIDVDDAYDVWPADLENELRLIAALHEEANRFDTHPGDPR